MNKRLFSEKDQRSSTKLLNFKSLVHSHADYLKAPEMFLFPGSFGAPQMRRRGAEPGPVVQCVSIAIYPYLFAT